MKSSGLLVLALLLTTAILTPSVLTLTSIAEKVVLIDFNEEEKKEEKKEATEKDLFSNSIVDFVSIKNFNTLKVSSFCIEKNYAFSVTVFVPPPERLV